MVGGGYMTKKVMLQWILNCYDVLLMDYHQYIKYYNSKQENVIDNDFYSVWSCQTKEARAILKHIVLWSNVKNEIDYRSHFDREYREEKYKESKQKNNELSYDFDYPKFEYKGGV